MLGRDSITESGDIKDLQRRIAAWADIIIPNRTAHHAMCKLVLEEIPEFLQNPDDPSEYADLIILILDVGHLRGIDVKQAVLDKMTVNENRSWVLDPATGLMRHSR